MSNDSVQFVLMFISNARRNVIYTYVVYDSTLSSLTLTLTHHKSSWICMAGGREPKTIYNIMLYMI